ncbi:MAG: PQQ-binding-like beta-propeller repeat protein [Rhodopirellula sp. JB044]|uniref:outer membrane protein assembly factor BamB family protein n=1 Tax=Rhodopirellula sp. JB044 TaxID=3342844 RepID=UPI00370C2952
MYRINSRLLHVVCSAATLLAMPSACAGVTSIDTGHTLTKVRVAQHDNKTIIVGSTYEGNLIALSDTGQPLWKRDLSGTMNHDVWCEDITSDQRDEILAANADGSVYCVSSSGELLWQFKANDAPMYAVCVLKKAGVSYVVCGGFDNNIYYLSATGEQVKVLPSSGYSIAKPWGNDPFKPRPPKGLHIANFLRKAKRADGSEFLVVHGTMNGMQDKGAVYLFEPLADQPHRTIPITAGKGVGDLTVAIDGNEILLGTSAHGNDSSMSRISLVTHQQDAFQFRSLKKRIDGFGYRVVQPSVLPNDSQFEYFIVYGRQIVLVPPNLTAAECEVHSCRYSFNDVWMDAPNQRAILASAQSGGSCVHIIDLADDTWKKEFAELQPPGKIAAILKASDLVRDKVQMFSRPEWERPPLPVYLMSESINDSVESIVEQIQQSSSSPVFLDHQHFGVAEDWDRSSLANEKYQNRRDRRRRYTLTHQQAVDALQSVYQTENGAAYWAGHGNDPYMFTLDTLKEVIDAADGRKTVLIYPELEDHSDDFDFVLKGHFYPLAQFAQDRNTQIYVRTKHCFWQGNVYLPMWNRLLSGEFADVFVPAMEETTDKSMELSLAGRSGIWASGATNSWGSRCARDNTSFDRGRQHSHQMLPNHFLRMMVYHISSGAQYIDNFSVDQEYMSLLWELIAKGVLYVPKRDEIVSYSPVHLSMHEPDHEYMIESSNVKWCTFYDAQHESKRPMVFSRLNGSWPGAPVTEWDFSRYAAGVNDRRLNFLPPYENGLVLITPPQSGPDADPDAPRGRLVDNLHPIYRNILVEHHTDGHHYLSADGQQTHAADQYATTVADDIRRAVKQLPLSVSGEVAWVAAQTSPNHLRLTLIDSGYINPKNRKAVIHFHTARPTRIRDVLFDTTFDMSDSDSVTIPIPLGMFRFIDIELASPLAAQ